jgi:hypothetical protein
MQTDPLEIYLKSISDGLAPFQKGIDCLERIEMWEKTLAFLNIMEQEPRLAVCAVNQKPKTKNQKPKTASQGYDPGGGPGPGADLKGRHRLEACATRRRHG